MRMTSSARHSEAAEGQTDRQTGRQTGRQLGALNARSIAGRYCRNHCEPRPTTQRGKDVIFFTIAACRFESTVAKHEWAKARRRGFGMSEAGLW